MNLESIMLSKRNWPQKTTHFKIPFIPNVQICGNWE